MQLSLFNRLKKQLHRDIASLQDEVVDIVYSIVPEAILHGGTALWRCYAGNRFSEDLDFYFSLDKKFRTELESVLESRQLKLIKFKQTQTTVFSKISNAKVEIRLEVNTLGKKKPVVQFFEKLDGTFMNVLTLSAEDLLLEKMSAYQNRKLIRDIYDVYFLSTKIKMTDALKESLKNSLKKLPEPVDEPNLKTIVYSGAIPNFHQIKQALLYRLGGDQK